MGEWMVRCKIGPTDRQEDQWMDNWMRRGMVGLMEGWMVIFIDRQGNEWMNG